MSKPNIYLDHNATTPLHPQVKKTMLAAMDEFGNPSSLHAPGRRARRLLEKAREDVASFINAESDELIFVGSGSEANNTVISMLSCCLSRSCSKACSGKWEIITTRIEHPCVLEAAKCAHDRGGNAVYLGVDNFGRVDLESLEKSITPDTKLISVMMANNEIGTIQDIKAIASLAHKHGVLMHSDAVQAVGKIPVDVKALDVDFLTLSAHKIYGPKGAGALYIRKGIPFCPLIRGGHQERGRRAGTENTLGIIGFGEAVNMRGREMQEEEKRLFGLKTKLKDAISSKIRDVHFNGHPRRCLPGTLNVSFAGAEGEAILLYLDLEGIYVSTGSACASGSLDPSHVLLATGLGAAQAHGSVRFSLGRDTTEKEIDYVIEVLPKVIDKIRGISTAYGKVEKEKEGL